MSQRIQRYFLIATIWQATALFAAADTLHVPAQFSNLRQALNAAHDGDEIVVSDGVYTGGKNKNLDFHGKRVRLRSEHGPRACVIDCQGVGRAFFFHSGETPDSILEGFTIRNGYALRGAGILCVGSSPTVRDCILSDNTAHPGYHSGGGGMSNQFGSDPVVTGCVFIGNQQVQQSDLPCGGGGMNNAYDSSPTVSDCSFIGNSAQQGGGMLNALECAPTVTNCMFFANTCSFTGAGLIAATNCRIVLRNCDFVQNISEQECGAIGSYSGTSMVLIGCTFLENHANYLGGGMASFRGEATLFNCSFVRNSTSPLSWDGGGGGMVSAGGTGTLYNCLFSGNNGGNGEAGAFGGGGPGTFNKLVNCTLTNNVANGGGALCIVSGANVEVTNCVLWNNTAATHGSEIAMIQFEDLYNPTLATISRSVVQYGMPAVFIQNPAFVLDWHADNLLADPLFADPWAGNFTLLAASPCIDTGVDGALPADTFDLDGDGDVFEPLPLDLAGAPRVLGDPPHIDFGAYEHVPE